MTGSRKSWAADLEDIATAPVHSQVIYTATGNAPEAFPLAAEILHATGQLLSVNSRRRWSTLAFRTLADLYDTGHEHVGQDSPDWIIQCERYRRLEIVTAGNITTPTTGHNRDANKPYKPPRTFRVRPRYLAAAILLLASLIVGVEGVHLNTYCARDGGWRGELTRPLHHDGLDLARTDDGQCVGVTDRPGAFIPQSRAPRSEDYDIATLTRLIADENEKVLRESKQHGKRYVTIVVATVLSTQDHNSAPGRTMSNGANELRGALTAQRARNKFDGPSEQVLLRLLIANLGGSAAHAERVADQIRRVAESDPTVVAVTGWGQTRNQTVRALERLSPDKANGWSGLSVVASTVSGDVFTGQPHFFRVGPSNGRQAEVAVKFIHEEPKLAERQIFIVFDDSDLYSDDLRKAFSGWLSFYRMNIASPPLSYHANVDNTAAQLRNIVEIICEKSQSPSTKPLIMFAGRGNEVPALLGDVNSRPCGGDPIVFAGDDVSTLETVGLQDFRPGQYKDKQLYYTSFGPTGQADYEEAYRRSGSIGSPSAGTTFFGRYEDVRRDISTAGSDLDTPATGDIMLAYDAIMLIGDRIQSLPEPTRELLYTSLRYGAPYHGAAGLVDFGSAADGQAPTNSVEKLVVVQQLVGTPGETGTNQLKAMLVEVDGRF